MLESILQPLFDQPQSWGVIAILSVVTGCLTALGTRRSLKDCELHVGMSPWFYGLAGTLLNAAFVLMVFNLACQSTPEVIPTETGFRLRLLSHLTLLTLLLMVTATDLKDFAILEWNCWLGILIALTGAVLTGDIQLAHVWVDWNAEIPQLQGPYIPAWLAVHPHLHGLSWSIAGIATGVGLTWLVRWVSSKILNMNTLGTGDIYLMAMIGAYLGWQPTLVAFLLAPLFALIVGGFIKLSTNRPALPYGPFLALGAMTVLFCWKWIWMAEIALSSKGETNRLNSFATRRFFGDPISLLVVIGGSSMLFVILLGLLRVYHHLPTKIRTHENKNVDQHG